MVVFLLITHTCVQAHTSTHVTQKKAYVIMNTHAQTHTCTDTHMHRHTHAQTHTCTDTHAQIVLCLDSLFNL